MLTGSRASRRPRTVVMRPARPARAYSRKIADDDRPFGKLLQELRRVRGLSLTAERANATLAQVKLPATRVIPTNNSRRSSSISPLSMARE